MLKVVFNIFSYVIDNRPVCFAIKPSASHGSHSSSGKLTVVVFVLWCWQIAADTTRELQNN